MELLVAAIVSSITTILVSIIGIVWARKAGLGQTQDKLVENLKDLVETYKIKVDMLEETESQNQEKIANLEGRVKELEDLTVSQAETIKILQTKRRITIQSPENGS